jgi:uncharacterized protein (TIGR04222 family)
VAVGAEAEAEAEAEEAVVDDWFFLWRYSGWDLIWRYPVACLAALAVGYGLSRLFGHRLWVRALKPYEAALVAGGRKRAVAAVLAVLRAEQVIERGSDGRFRLAGGPPSAGLGTPLDAAVQEVIGQQDPVGHVDSLADHPRVAAELRLLEITLERKGLIFPPYKLIMRRVVLALPLWLVFAAGAVRMVSYFLNGSMWGLILMFFVLYGTGAVCLALSAELNLTGRPRTPAGSRALRETRRRNAHLDPALSPAWRTYGPLGVAFGVALFGADAMTRFDHELAEQTRATAGNLDRPSISVSVGGGENTSGCFDGAAGGGDGCDGCGCEA